MGRRIIDKLVMWLRRKHPGTVFRMRDFFMEYLVRILGIVPLSASLKAKVFRVDGTVEDLGVVSTHAVTDVFVALLVDTLQAAAPSFSTFKWHGSGTGTTGELSGDTVLETPTGEARVVGTQIEGATGNIYKSVAIHTYAGTFDITEHGLFNALIVGVLADRSVFTAIGVIAGDKIQFSYELVCTSGG